jgi:hypothetical protein
MESGRMEKCMEKAQASGKRGRSTLGSTKTMREMVMESVGGPMVSVTKVNG